MIHTYGHANEHRVLGIDYKSMESNYLDENNMNPVMCSECTVQPAIEACIECNEAFCSLCAKRVHETNMAYREHSLGALANLTEEEMDMGSTFRQLPFLLLCTD